MKTAPVLVLSCLAVLPAASQSAAAISLTLREAEDIAILNSDALRLQNLKTESSVRRFGFGIRDFLPQLELGYSGASSVNIGADDTSSNQISLSLKQPIFNGGRNLVSRTLARLELTLNRQSIEVARQDVLNNVWEQFHQVLVLQAQLDVKRRALDRSTKQLDIARTEREIGMIREIDLIDVELSIANQEIDLQSTESELEKAWYVLKKTLGLPPDQEVELQGKIDSNYRGIEIEKPISFFQSIAREHNLDLQAARYRVTQMESQLLMVRSQFLPQINANLSLSVAGRTFPLQSPSINVGLEISFPQSIAPVRGSVSGGATGQSTTSGNFSASASPLQSITGLLDESDATLALEEARAAADALEKDLAFQIGQGISEYARQQKAIELGRRSLELENRKLAILEQQVKSGSATRIDLLNEQAQAADREVRLLSDILGLIQREKALEKVSGMEPGELARLTGEVG